MKMILGIHQPGDPADNKGCHWTNCVTDHTQQEPRPLPPPPPTADEWASILGEGIHTGFRKGTEHPKSHDYWMMIAEMPNELWNEVLDYLVWSLEYMNLIDITKED